MSYELSVKQMRSLLALSEDDRNMDWAHDVCTMSRFVHINVWKFCAPREYVRTQVIPLLENAKKQLLNLANMKGFDTSKILDYAENDTARIKNLKDNYLEQKPSAFRPGDKLSEPEFKAGDKDRSFQ